MNGTVLCVFQVSGQLVYSTANPPGYGFSPPVAPNSGAFGIYSATSPELFVLDHVLYCVYQNADGEHETGISLMRE